MKLAKCTKCNRTINIDELEELDGDEVLGCGLNKGDYLACEDCHGQHRVAECHTIRREGGFTKTTIAELLDADVDAIHSEV